MRYLLLALALTAATLASPTCPEDDSKAYFTGRTRTSSAGKQMKEYKCYLYGHLFWAQA